MVGVGCTSSAPGRPRVDDQVPRRAHHAPRGLVVRRHPRASSRSATRACSTSMASSSLRLSTQYIVDVHGKARLRDDAGLVADHGDVHAAAALLRFGSRQAGRPQRRRLRRGADRGHQGTPVREPRPHRQARAGLTTIQGRYYGADGKVSGDAGGNDLPDPAVVRGKTETTGTSTSAQDPQVASIRLPATDPDGAEASIEPLDDDAGGRRPRRPHEGARDGNAGQRRRPGGHRAALRRLPVRGSGRAARRPGGPGSEARRGAERHLLRHPGLLGPRGHAARCDVLPGPGSSRTEDGGVVLVVRSTTTSRWIIR